MALGCKRAWRTHSLAGDSELAAALTKLLAGRELDEVGRARVNFFHANLLFGFENLLRMHEQGLVDPDMFLNSMMNSAPYLLLPDTQEFLKQRPGPLSARLASFIRQNLGGHAA